MMLGLLVIGMILVANFLPAFSAYQAHRQKCMEVPEHVDVEPLCSTSRSHNVCNCCQPADAEHKTNNCMIDA